MQLGAFGHLGVLLSSVYIQWVTSIIFRVHPTSRVKFMSETDRKLHVQLD